MALLFTDYVLNVVKSQGRSSSRVLQWLSGESFIMPMDETLHRKSN